MNKRTDQHHLCRLRRKGGPFHAIAGESSFPVDAYGDHKFFSPDLYIQKAETSIKLHEKIIAFHLIPEDGKCIIDISTEKQGTSASRNKIFLL